MPTMNLSPAYGMSPVRLGWPGDHWPGLLLHSRSLAWAFDAHDRPLEQVVDLSILATRAGLWEVSDPFGGDIAAPREPWTFHLPTARNPARLDAPGMTIVLDRAPLITADWWSAAVNHGGRCRMLVAACVAFPTDNPEAIADVLNDAAVDHRVFGAMIGVEF